MQWDGTGIRVWYFSRNTIPADALYGDPDPSQWPAPSAAFTGNSCDWNERFKNNKVVINLDFCGSWAGNAWESSGW
jgi:hypothetical protein